MSKINLTVKEPKTVELNIINDGRGFEFEHTKGKKEHFGLATMKERVEEIEGEFILESQPGRGIGLKLLSKYCRG